MVHGPTPPMATQCAKPANSIRSVLRDEIDRQILALLVEDGRATFHAVGEAVGLSAPAAKRRVDRLVADGTITGFTALVDPAAEGSTLEAFVELHCQGTVSPESVLDIVRPHHQVIDAYTVSGTADALVHLRCTDVTELERTLEQVRADHRVARTSTIIVLSRLFSRPG
jgi:DNA-binding Lrp family transcriptional regulator